MLNNRSILIRGAADPITLGLVLVLSLFIGWPKVKGIFHRDATKPVAAAEAKIEAKEAQIDSAEKTIVKSAQEDVKATSYALADGNVKVATEFNDRAYGKLSVVVGPVEPKVERELRDLVTKLQSQVDTVRAEAQRQLDARDKKSDEQIAKLAKLQAELDVLTAQLKEATDKLKAAYVKAEADAAAYQNLVFLFRIALVGGAIALLYGLYTRIFTVGGIFKRIGTTLNDSADDKIVAHLDANLDTWMQKAVAKARKLGSK